MRVKFKLIIYLALICFYFSNGQRTDYKNINNNWVFGNKTGINFSTDNPTSFNNINMSTYEGVATISNELGELLFYTEGYRVFNKNHEVMQNGSQLSGSGFTFIQGVVILPYPGSPNEYLIFTTNGNSTNIVAYSRIDMSLNNGLGRVVQRNVPLLNDNGNTSWDYEIEAITSVNNGNNNYWVLIPYKDKLLSYKIDNSGIVPTPVQSVINDVGNTTDT